MRSIKAGLLATLAIFLYCCNSHNFIENPLGEGDRDQLTFSSYVEGVGSDDVVTRKTGNRWEANDAIGLFSFETGKPNSQATVDANLNNREFITLNGLGQFSTKPGTPSVPYPTERKDFIAYFPYKSDVLISEDFTYPIDLANQLDIDKIDLLYSNNLKDFNLLLQPELRFKHVLSRLKLTITSKKYDLTGAKVELTNFNAKADFNLISGVVLVDQSVVEVVNLPYTLLNGEMTINALILPTQKAQDFTVKITLKDGQVARWNNHKDAGWIWEQGRVYTKAISIGETGGVDPDPQPEQKYGFFETPQGNETSNTQFVVHNVPSGASANLLKDANGNPQRNFTMLYDKEYKIAHWVAYPQHKNYVGSAKRTNAWAYDPLIDRGYQINLKSSYKENYSRGHQIASGDRTADAAVNRPTFYYSNMTPQIQNGLNGDIWAHLEQAVRGYVPGNDTLWVVTGAGLPKDKSQIKYAHSKDGEPTAIPTYYYKVVAKKVGGKFYTLGYRLEQRVHTKGEHYDDFRVTVKALEEETGFTFFPSIPAEDKEVIVNSQW